MYLSRNIYIHCWLKKCQILPHNIHLHLAHIVSFVDGNVAKFKRISLWFLHQAFWYFFILFHNTYFIVVKRHEDMTYAFIPLIVFFVKLTKNLIDFHENLRGWKKLIRGTKKSTVYIKITSDKRVLSQTHTFSFFTRFLNFALKKNNPVTNWMKNMENLRRSWKSIVYLSWIINIIYKWLRKKSWWDLFETRDI